MKIPLAFEICRRVAISFAAKLSAIETTTIPASMVAKYIITALTVIGISIATASPRENHAFSAFATNLQKPGPLVKENLPEKVKKNGNFAWMERMQ